MCLFCYCHVSEILIELVRRGLRASLVTIRSSAYGMKNEIIIRSGNSGGNAHDWLYRSITFLSANTSFLNQVWHTLLTNVTSPDYKFWHKLYMAGVNSSFRSVQFWRHIYGLDRCATFVLTLTSVSYCCKRRTRLCFNEGKVGRVIILPSCQTTVNRIT